MQYPSKHETVLAPFVTKNSPVRQALAEGEHSSVFASEKVPIGEIIFLPVLHLIPLPTIE